MRVVTGDPFWVAVTVMLGTTSVILATTIVNVVLPDIMRDFAVDQTRAQWLVTGFLSAMAATMLTTAWWVRTYGLRRTYTVAVWIFIAVSVVGGVSTSIDILIVSRVLQGAVAGVIQPLAMIALFAVFPVEERGRAMAAYGLGAVLSPALGPVLGGALGEWLGWRSVFFITLPLCFAALGLIPRHLAGFEREPGDRPVFDFTGFILLCVFLLFVLGGLAYIQRNGLTLTGSLAGCAGAVLAGIGFIRWELLRCFPLFDPRVFQSRTFTLASVVGFAYGMGLYGSTFLIPLFVQTIAGYTALQAGLLLLPGGLVLALVIPHAGRWTDRTSPHRVICTGLGCFTLSFFLLATSSPASGFWVLAGWIALGRLGLALMIPALNAGAFHDLPAMYIAQGAGALNFVRQLGGAFGTCLLSLLLQWRMAVRETVPHMSGSVEKLWIATRAFDDSFMMVGVIFAVALFPAWRLRRT